MSIMETLALSFVNMLTANMNEVNLVSNASSESDSDESDNKVDDYIVLYNM